MDALDLATRCGRCRVLRYFDVNGEGRFLFDASWMCGGCIALMDGRYVWRRFTLSSELLEYLTWRRS